MACVAFAAGPFGFEKGMTKTQVVALLGADHVKTSNEPDLLKVTSAPNPYPLFEDYALMFSPTEGLLKIRALSKDVGADAYGFAMKADFQELQESLTAIYGSPSSAHDILLSGSMWTDPQYWMMGLLKKQRILYSVWILKSAAANHVTTVQLQAVGTSTDAGFLELDYEFESFTEYVKGLKAKDAGVL